MEERKDRITTRVRMYDDINTEVLESLPVLAPNWTSHGIDEPGVAILQVLTGLSDALYFNLDMRARETFLSTAVLPESIHDIAHMLHYRPKRWIAAAGELVIGVPFYDDANPSELEGTGEGSTRIDYFVPAFTQITLPDGTRIVTLEDINIPTSFSGQLYIPVLEGTYKTFTSTISPSNIFGLLLPPENIAEQLFEVYVNNELWFDATDYPLNAAIDNFYYIKRNAEGRYELGFRTSRGRVPRYGDALEVRYLVTRGTNLNANSLDTAFSPINNNSFTWSYTDFTDASQPETLEQVRDRAPAKNSTSDRAVNIDDYRELAKQLPNVKSVYVRKSRTGWNTVEIFVATKDGAVSSSEQLQMVREFFQKRNNLVVSVRTLPATFRRFNLRVSFRPMPNFNGAKVLNEVRTGLLDMLSYNNLNFSSAIRISDIYAKVDSIPGVDFSNIQALHWITEDVTVRNLVSLENEYPFLQDLTISLE